MKNIITKDGEKDYEEFRKKNIEVNFVLFIQGGWGGGRHSQLLHLAHSTFAPRALKKFALLACYRKS